MSNNTLPVTTRNRLPATTEAQQFVSITIGKQSFGIPVLLVHDVLGPQRITRIPLAPKEVAGSSTCAVASSPRSRSAVAWVWTRCRPTPRR